MSYLKPGSSHINDFKNIVHDGGTGVWKGIFRGSPSRVVMRNLLDKGAVLQSAAVV